jgi:hypothetical protein
MARMGPLARIGNMTPWGRSAAKKAMKTSMPAGMRGPIGARTAARNKALNKSGAKTLGAAAFGATGAGMIMSSGRNSSSQRGGYSPPRLREPRGSGRYA